VMIVITFMVLCAIVSALGWDFMVPACMRVYVMNVFTLIVCSGIDKWVHISSSCFFFQWLFRCLWGFGFTHLHVKGAPVSWSQAPFLVCNHLGIIEATYLLAACRASAVTAAENLRVPVLRR
jgi:hypothetical protein